MSSEAPAPAPAAIRHVALLVPYRTRGARLEFFLQKRDGNALHYPNKIGFFGGHVEVGETAEAAMLREAHEELVFRPVGWFHLLRQETPEVIRDIFAVEVGPDFESTIQVREGERGAFLSASAAAAEPLFIDALRGVLVSLAARVRQIPVDPEVEAFLTQLIHPMKAELMAVRQLILRASPEIREGIKWKAPSFRTTEYFATLNLRARGGEDRVWLILHTGAKIRHNAMTGLQLDDTTGILEWLAKDRCIVTFRDAADVAAKGPALQAVIREWINHM